jgi:hypothetical protein
MEYSYTKFLKELPSFDKPIEPILYDSKERTFNILDNEINLEQPISIPSRKQRTYTTDEMIPETDLEQILMEIAVQSRLFSFQTYVFHVKLAHRNALRKDAQNKIVPILTKIKEDPLHEVDCRNKNKAEYELLTKKITWNQ